MPTLDNDSRRDREAALDRLTTARRQAQLANLVAEGTDPGDALLLLALLGPRTRAEQREWDRAGRRCR